MKTFLKLMVILALASCSSAGSGENGGKEQQGQEAQTKPQMKEQLLCNTGDWAPSDVQFPQWHQGMAICDGYLFTFQTGGYVYIYNIAQRNLAGSFKIETTNHCNSACFSTDKYSPVSKFPMLYLSESVNDCNCEVYDITLTVAKKVQDIILKDHPEGSHGAGWSVDAAKGCYYLVFDKAVYTFPIHFEKTVEFTLSDGKRIASWGDVGAAQAMNSDNDYVYQLSGLGEGGETISLYDLANDKTYKYKLPRSNEPEGVCSWNGHVYIGYAGPTSRELLVYQTDFVR